MKLKRRARLILYRDAKQEIRMRLIAPNGRIVLPPESYKRKQGAMRARASIIKHLPTAKIIDET